jgi:glycerol-3-phosphate dehydrogenase (NAD(P)+)
MQISILGAGAWGTATAIAFAARHSVRLWARDEVQVAQMQTQRENQRYLPGCPFPAALELHSNLAAATANAELLILATPLVGLRPLLERLQQQYLATGTSKTMPPFVWLCKGLEAATGKLPHQLVAEVFSKHPQHTAPPAYGALTGPSFALEVARGLPTALTLASPEKAFATQFAHALHGGHMRVYANDDLIGAEVGGATKNIMAIATGVSDGLGLGNNARAALITRGLVEITRFGTALGAHRDTFTGLTGLGDLILTCTGDLSRNRRVGLLLAEGRTLTYIQNSLGHVAEGISTAREVARRADNMGINMPITAAVAQLLAGEASAQETVQQLMARDVGTE